MARRDPSTQPAGGISLGLCWLLLALAQPTGCKKNQSIPTSDAAPGSVVAVAQAPADRPADEARRGVGWYPNIEVDADNRLHLAWVDADVGDVRYAVSAPGASSIEATAVEPVDVRGAVGAYLRLAVGPGGVPFLLYMHQDEKTLRLAHRPNDRAALAAAGGDIDDSPMPELGLQPVEGRPGKAAGAFVVEDVAFGSEVGRGGALVLDEQARPHVLYYAGDQLRLARRPRDVPAFGPGGLGHWEKLDVDTASASPRVQTDLRILRDGTLVASYAHDVMSDSRLRMAVFPAGADGFAVFEHPGPPIELDGTLSTIVADDAGAVDVAAWHQSEGALMISHLDVKTPAPPTRTRLLAVDGAALARRSATGTFVLARSRNDDDAGVFLFEIPLADTAQARRTRLQAGRQDDSWIDVAVRPDGRPAAVWYSAEKKALMLYAP